MIMKSLSISDGHDYELIGGDVSFNANKEVGEAVDCQGLTVRIRDDPIVEGTEQVQIRLESDQPHRILVDSSIFYEPVTSIVIEDDDCEYLSNTIVSIVVG